MNNQNIVRKINARARMLEENRLMHEAERDFGIWFWLSIGALALYVLWGM